MTLAKVMGDCGRGTRAGALRNRLGSFDKYDDLDTEFIDEDLVRVRSIALGGSSVLRCVGADLALSFSEARVPGLVVEAALVVVAEERFDDVEVLFSPVAFKVSLTFSRIRLILSALLGA